MTPLLGITLVVALAIGIGLLYIILKINSGPGFHKLDKKVVFKKWQDIELMMKSGNPSNFSNAVMEADKLFDYVLKSAVGDRKGQTMGERLKLSQKKFSSWDIYQDVWSAHKIRNKTVHEVSHEMHSSVAKKAIEQFRRGLKDLKVL